jgi:tetratricopeptide (TPR) repeat protein
MDRLAWNRKTLVESYERTGYRNPAWDEPAQRALTAFAELRSQPGEADSALGQVIATNCDLAVRAGCKDSLIEYLHIRFLTGATNNARAVADALCKVAIDIQQTPYPAVRKFYCARRAVQQFYEAYGYQADPSALEQIGSGADYAPEILNDPTIPIEEAYEVCSETLEAHAGAKNVARYQEIYQLLEPMFIKWPEDHRSWLIKGRAHLGMAWVARGGGYADGVSAAGWKGFSKNLALAADNLEKAWQLNPKDARIPTLMIRVEEGQGQGRERMERWFNRAMSLDPSNYEACKNKLHYLYPQWYGSREDMIAFGRQCVATAEWTGRVPLVLVDAHWEYAAYLEDGEKESYWKRPDVWPDIESAFERFFKLNPRAISCYPVYAWYAYHCAAWDKLNELTPKLGPDNYAYFGGEAEFNRMVRIAREHAPKVR